MSNKTVIIDLAARYAAAFGLMSINEKINTAVVEDKGDDYDLSFYPDHDPEIERVVFSYQDEKLTFSNMINPASDQILAPPMLIEFRRKKRLIETTASGSDNVVVERWGTDPYQIDMRGLLVNMSNKSYPEREIEALTAFFEINDIIDVEGIQFEDKRISNIYFTDIRIEPVEGFTDTLKYQLRAKAIKALGFNLLNLGL